MTVVGRMVAAGTIAVGFLAFCGSAHAAVVTRQTGFAGHGASAGWAQSVWRAGATGMASSIWRAGSAGQITSPSDGQVVSSSSVTVSARTDLMQLTVGLYVEGPSTPSQKVAAGGANQTISGTFEAGDAPNGSFTVILKGELTGTRYASSTFKLRRPAAAPGNVHASKQGTEKVAVTWSKGSEPDLQSYEVSSTQSGVVGRLPADSACSGSSCKAVLAVPAKAAGQRVGFTVKAFRGDGDGGSIASDDSAAAYIAFPAAPSAQPTKKKTTDSRQTTRSRDPRGVEALPTLPSKRQAVPSAKPTTRKPATTKLPGIPDADPNGNLPIPDADQQGENGGLVPADAKGGDDSAPVQSDGVKAQSSESPIGNIGQYGLYVAGGIVLLLLGAHAGAWARRRALATEGVASTPPSAAAAQASAPIGVVSPAARVVTGADSAQAVGGSSPAVSVRRRPAVILAVAKTRVPEADPSRTARPELDPDADLDVQTPLLAAAGVETPQDARGRQQAVAGELPWEMHERQLDAADGSSLEGPVHEGERVDRPSSDARRQGGETTGRSSAGARMPEEETTGRLSSDDRSRRDGAAGRLSSDAREQESGVLGRLPSDARGREREREREAAGEVPSGAGGRQVRTVGEPPYSSRRQRLSSGAEQSLNGGEPASNGGGVARSSYDGESGRSSYGEGVMRSSYDGESGRSSCGEEAVRSRAAGSRPDGARRSAHLADSDFYLPGPSSRVAAPSPYVADAFSVHVDVEHVRTKDVERVRARDEGRGGQEAHGVAVRLALPRSAVTDVPESAAAALPARLEERWDDYLPPAPRSMEDSGFWERPQPGAGDFWAADDDAAEGDDKGGSRSFAGRRHSGGDS
ncbi:hypothetical protein AB0M50_27500 [Nonomuraea fuscirosea]|uniref:hypothetical protein n=1 Tax=Nonomuraea fuscirosea TaxID=1291556 RepID=UPI003434B94F